MGSRLRCIAEIVSRFGYGALDFSGTFLASSRCIALTHWASPVSRVGSVLLRHYRLEFGQLTDGKILVDPANACALRSIIRIKGIFQHRQQGFLSAEACARPDHLGVNGASRLPLVSSGRTDSQPHDSGWRR
jgi:hypothetical protein